MVYLSINPLQDPNAYYLYNLSKMLFNTEPIINIESLLPNNSHYSYGLVDWV